MPLFSSWLFKLFASFIERKAPESPRSSGSGSEAEDGSMGLHENSTVACLLEKSPSLGHRSADESGVIDGMQAIGGKEARGCCAGQRKRYRFRYLVRKAATVKALRPDIQRERSGDAGSHLNNDELESATRGRGKVRFNEFVEIGTAPVYDRTPCEPNLDLIFLRAIISSEEEFDNESFV